MADHFQIAGNRDAVATMPLRIHWSRFNGMEVPRGAKLITRPGRFGNPYKVSVLGTAEKAVAAFEAYLQERREAKPGWTDPFPKYPSDAEIRAQLGGFDLACECKPGQPCHGDPLLRVANPGLLAVAGG